jgi:uncharacterized protein YgiM (DUF1202 family)
MTVFTTRFHDHVGERLVEMKSETKATAAGRIHFMHPDGKVVGYNRVLQNDGTVDFGNLPPVVAEIKSVKGTALSSELQSLLRGLPQPGAFPDFAAFISSYKALDIKPSVAGSVADLEAGRVYNGVVRKLGAIDEKGWARYTQVEIFPGEEGLVTTYVPAEVKEGQEIPVKLEEIYKKPSIASPFFFSFFQANDTHPLDRLPEIKRLLQARLDEEAQEAEALKRAGEALRQAEKLKEAEEEERRKEGEQRWREEQRKAAEERAAKIRSITIFIGCIILGAISFGMLRSGITGAIIYGIVGAIIGGISYGWRRTSGKIFKVVGGFFAGLLAILLIGLSVILFITKSGVLSEAESGIESVEAPASVTATVTNNTANIRSAPDSGKNNIITSVKNGDTLTVTGPAENGWLPVEVDGKPGYVSADLVKIND